MGVPRRLAVALSVVLLPLMAPVAAAAPVTGNATHFSGLGQPYGGCGMPQADRFASQAH